MKRVKVDRFKDEVLLSTMPVFVYFTASWCTSCKRMLPIVLEMEKEFEGQVKFKQVDLHESPELARKYEVRALPCSLVFWGGELVADAIGQRSKNQLRQMLSRFCD